MTMFPAEQVCAAIAILDWKGPEFLWFYGSSLAAVSLWCLVRLRMGARKFELKGRRVVTPSDPYELAYLSGGAVRVTQVAIVRLVGMKLIRWKQAIIPKLIAFPADPVTLMGTLMGTLERTLLDAVQNSGKSGLPVNQARFSILSELPAIECRLAILGLRPTSRERRKATVEAIMPMCALIILGLVKLGIGISRDKPVGFLVALIVLSLLVTFALQQAFPRVTEDGKRVIDAEAGKWPTPDGRRQFLPAEAMLSEISHATAMKGPAILFGLAAFEGMEKSLISHLGGASGGDGYGGYSGGCGAGGSGCGGASGCGGCSGN